MTFFLTLRVLHILLAAIWFGAAMVLTFFIAPAARGAKAAGGAVMSGAQQRGLMAFMAVVPGLTVLTGIYLLWHFTNGFDPSISATTAGRVFGAGGAAGIVAVILGGSVIGRSMKKAVDLMVKAGPMAEGPEKAALLRQAGQLQDRADVFSKIVLVLMVIAIVTMSVGHYV